MTPQGPTFDSSHWGQGQCLKAGGIPCREVTIHPTIRVCWHVSEIPVLNLPEYWWGLCKIPHRLWASSYWSILPGPQGHGTIVVGQHSPHVWSAQQSAVAWGPPIWRRGLGHSLPSTLPPSSAAISMNFPICQPVPSLIIYIFLCYI